MRIEELDTPAVVIDLDILERNIAKLATYCRENQVALRPHIKTHKMPELARRQINSGAIGVTAAKVGEAEIMADAGVEDILIAYPIVSAEKAKAIAELLKRCRVTVSLDSIEAAQVLSSAMSAAGVTLNTLVEIDVGFGRCGVQDAAQTLVLAQQIDALPGLKLKGLMYYPGHLFIPHDEQSKLIPVINEKVEAAYRALESAGLDVSIVSAGSTPTAYRAHEFTRVTEIRPGMYLLNDRNLLLGGFTTLEECALSVHVTVVSTAVPGKAIHDGGSKTFSSDRLLTGDGKDFGLVVEDDAAAFYGMSEEHGHLKITESSKSYRVGERLHIIPNHVCTTINMHDQVYAARNGVVEAVWSVAARGRVR